MREQHLGPKLTPRLEIVGCGGGCLGDHRIPPCGYQLDIGLERPGVSDHLRERVDDLICTRRDDYHEVIQGGDAFKIDQTGSQVD